MFVLRETVEKSAKTISSEVTLIVEVARAVWRWKRLALGTFLALSDLVFVACFVITPKFEASTLLVVGQNSLDGSSEASRSTSEFSASMVQIVESPDVIRRAVEQVGLAKLVRSTNNPTIGTVRTIPVISEILSLFARPPNREIAAIDRAIPSLSSALEVKRELNSNVIRVSFRHEDPVTAANFVNAVAQSFVDRQLVLFSRPGAADFYQRQKVKFDEEIGRASDELRAFVATNKIYSIYDERQLLLKRSSDASAALTMTRGSISDKTGQKETLTSQLRLLKPVTQSPFVSSLVNALGGDDRAEKNNGATPKIPLQTDERHLSDAPPLLMVRVYQDTMVALFKVNGELTGLANLQQEQTGEIQRLKLALEELSIKEAEFVRLERVLAQASLNSDIYARKMIEEQISAESNAAKFSTIKIFQQAYPPIKPNFPNYRLLAGFGLAAALVAAVAVALVADALARREPNTGAPISLGDFTLPLKRRRQHDRGQPA
jgi:uncharacterized protein involved in exopolysaccharide biosynthesis